MHYKYTYDINYYATKCRKRVPTFRKYLCGTINLKPTVNKLMKISHRDNTIYIKAAEVRLYIM